MRASKWLLAAVPLFLLLASADPPRARACGACFHVDGESTQVTGHRMIFSISQARTTLWDQILYTGDPGSFAWVLPVKGTVEIGLSSDALFGVLDQNTAVTVVPPPLDCPSPPSCYYDNYGGYGGEGDYGGAGGASSGVDVVSQAVVGPYETVTLHSTDPNALTDWLGSHGYVVPVDFAPVVSTYIQEGFDFVALKLVPGQGVSAMRPVRITTPGAGLSLPLRMVAGGTGATTTITLWILGEGRYEPKNFPTFTIKPSQLVWDWATDSSNYATLRDTAFPADAWQTESSGTMPTTDVSNVIDQGIFDDPAATGYGDANGVGADLEAEADYAKLWGTLPGTPWLTRLRAALPHAALASDLELGASADQTPVPSYLTAASALNIPPCPVYTCDGGSGGTGGAGGSGSSGGCGKGCTVGSESERSAAYSATILAFGLLLLRRRRPRR
jgi:hypothetical protein